jgi:hypothetical protein
MQTFKNIYWRKHKICEGIQGNLILDSGLEMSIVAGENLYCTPRTSGKSYKDFVSYEVLIWGVNDNEPFAYQSKNDINKLIKKYN